MEKRRVGRPRDPVRRVALSLRVTPQCKARLDEMTANSGRSISQEAELRLERSFDRDAIDAKLDEILALIRNPNP